MVRDGGLIDKETMDKETKELLKRTLAMTDDKLLLNELTFERS